MRRIRYWLADLLERLALKIGDDMHGQRCSGLECYCRQEGREHRS